MNTNKKKGTELEKTYEWLWTITKGNNFLITSPKFYKDNITNTTREIDVFIEVMNDFGEVVEKIMVECRNRAKVEDVTWIEQVVTKRNDSNADRAIMITTKNFTKPARKKADHYNVEIERASSLNKEFLDEQSKHLIGKNKFVLMECLDIMITTDNGILRKNDIMDNDFKNFVKKQINAFSYSEDFLKIIKDSPVYKEENNIFITNKSITFDFGFVPQKLIKTNILENKNHFNFKKFDEIKRINFKLMLTPKILKFPVTKFFTVFDDKLEKLYSNKRHKSLYENEKIKVVFQFIKNDEASFDVTIKNKNIFWRHIGWDITVYALFKNITNFNINNSPEELLGKIYFNNF